MVRIQCSTRGVNVMMFNTTFNNISVISWWSVLLWEETRENNRSVVSHWQVLTHNVAFSTPRLSGIRTHIHLKKKTISGFVKYYLVQSIVIVGCSRILPLVSQFTRYYLLVGVLHSITTPRTRIEPLIFWTEGNHSNNRSKEGDLN
jgi:hypothetical protein